ncbi:RAMP superfamily protein [Saccharopolyspora sp. TS4A08]|uniref:RAMP superfamily protein n=1 Tax=Saccharopolyspora ipomoeae TaxID=3042027 RepID=A0ABT6PPD2_9PSEU|nr:RAMP superfamily CRISPR-associated protein [Saccharopolyspora sp. TS4A08]MDI2029513.1 RAMP superfamily protein [Saccharopolyspora sp. TS4A08]
MNRLDLTITFHGPFRVSTGHARAGIDAAIDAKNPLPSTSLKGVMRGTAKLLLGENALWVEKVFGSHTYECPWRWSAATADWQPTTAAARVAIDPATHTARPDMLGISEQTGATTAAFSITQRGHIDPDELETHLRVLAISAQATRSLGANRRRGLGWVSLSCDHPLDRDAVETFLRLRAQLSPQEAE